MSEIKSILAAVSEAEDYTLKTRLCEYLNQYLESDKPGAADREALADFAFEQIEELIRAIPAAADYKSKDVLMAYEDQLMELLMKGCPAPRALPPERVELIRTIVGVIEAARFFENAVDKLFRQEDVYPAFVEQLVNTHKQLTDEYQKEQLYLGMLHYKDKLVGFSDQCKAVFGNYIATETARYLQGTLTPQALSNLELIADIAKHIPTDALLEQIYAVLKLGHNQINIYIMDSLLSLGREVPADRIAALANDLIYADVTYHLLKQHGMTSDFPAELVNEEYLAKSDLVHWLTYPTELGKAPDEIEYLGKVKSKGENYRVFRYKSDSDNLDDELKGKWLIGWSGDEGGTFSQYDEYALYEQKTPEKTLKFIKNKLIG